MLKLAEKALTDKSARNQENLEKFLTETTNAYSPWLAPEA